MTSPVIKVTQFLVFCLPIFLVLAAFAVIAAATVYLFGVRLHRRWLKICTRTAAAVLVLPLILTLLLLIGMVGCTSRPRILVSPDAQHVAAYTYDAGWLGRDTTFVTVRKKWGIRPEVVYQYAGPSEWSSTQVRWLSNDRLVIQYEPEQSPQVCKTEAAGVLVQCVTK